MPVLKRPSIFAGRSILARFRGARAGNVSIIFGLAAIPMVAMTGLAVDYTRGASARTSLQAAVDATVLHLARSAGSKSQAELVTMANALVPAQLPGGDGIVLQGLTVTKGERTVELSARAQVKTTFSAILDIRTMDLAAAGSAVFGRQVEIALVLDNTGSMGNTLGGVRKIDQLKSSVNKLLADLKAAAFEPDQIRVSIVPFDTQVNIGTGFRNELWLDFNPALPPRHWNAKTTKAAWTGCVIDREQPYDANATAPAGGATRHPAVQCETGRLSQVTPLKDVHSGSDYGALTRAVGLMTPSGCTNVTIGAHWGRETLSRGAPFSEASGNAGVLRFMILLTDGDNTQNRWVDACSGGGSATAIDSRTTAMCGVIKGEGTEVFTIGFGGGSKAVLGNCASKPSNYADVQSPAALDAVFAAILKEILRIRLTS